MKRALAWLTVWTILVFPSLVVANNVPSPAVQDYGKFKKVKEKTWPCGVVTRFLYQDRYEKYILDISWDAYFLNNESKPLLIIYNYISNLDKIVYKEFFLDNDRDGNTDYHERNDYPSKAFWEKYPTPCDAVK